MLTAPSVTTPPHVVEEYSGMLKIGGRPTSLLLYVGCFFLSVLVYCVHHLCLSDPFSNVLTTQKL